MTKCAVTEDLNRHLKQMDDEAAYEMTCERAYLDLIGDLIGGDFEDDALYEEIAETLNPVELMRVFLDYENPSNAGLFEKIKKEIREMVEGRAEELAPKSVEAERQAAEEDEAERKAEARGLL